MLEKLRIIFTIPDLRNKVLLTIALLAVYRIGWQIPLPIIDQAQISEFAKSLSSGTMGQFLEKVSVFSASQLTQATIFGLGIMPYISASIIMQLLTHVVPSLEQLRKEGETGRKTISKYTRYGTLILATVQAVGVCVALQSQQAGGSPLVYFGGVGFILTGAISLVLSLIHISEPTRPY